MIPGSSRSGTLPPLARLRRLGCAAALLLLCACGGNKSTWQIVIKTPPGDDLFKMGVSQVRLTVADKTQTSTVTAGQFSVSIAVEEPKQDQYVRITVEALNTAGQVVARGYSPNVVLTVGDSTTTQVVLYVARSGKISATAVSLLADDMKTPNGRSELAAVALRGRAVTPVAQSSLGVLIAGGVVDDKGTLPALSWLYDPLTHSLLNAGNPKVARRGAVLVPSADANLGEQAVLFGGQDKDGKLPSAAEVFDPQVASLDVVFTTPAVDVANAPGAVAPALTEVSAGVFLVSGGLDKVGGVPIAAATLVQRFPAATGATDTSARPGVRGLLPVMDKGPLVAARAGHSATPVVVKEGQGALLFGGTADAAAPLAEVFALNGATFRELKLSKDPAEPRRDHVAAPLRDGRVLIAGGRASDGALLRSALLISPTGEVESRSVFLQTARARASVATFGDEILICGGVGVVGMTEGPLATCEIFTQDGIAASMIGRQEPMPRPRVGHQMVALETGNLLFIGGTGAGDIPVAEIDAYTAP